MTPRARWLATLEFGTPDRIPFDPGHGRQSTRQRWHAEGLPSDEHDIIGYTYRLLGGQHSLSAGGPTITVDERMRPQFEEKVIERREHSQIVQDWKGNVCEIGNEFTVDYLRNAIDFVTRRWLRCPVETRDDWRAMMARYDANDPARIACDQTTLEALRDRDYVWTVAFSGPFWQVREWVGFESLCTMLIDEPAWVAEMIDFWKEYVATLLRRLLTMAVPDHVHVSEDMAYKRFAMISPTMAREFLLPTWRYWCDILRGAGVRVVGMDSDGFIGELIPLWIDAGFTMCDPIEVAAGNDIVEFRRQFGRSMAYRGGIDKREIAKGGSAIDAEIRRIEPVIRSGGFIPSCDHGVPADVSWQAWLDYCHALAKTTGWL